MGYPVHWVSIKVLSFSILKYRSAAYCLCTNYCPIRSRRELFYHRYIIILYTFIFITLFCSVCRTSSSSSVYVSIAGKQLPAQAAKVSMNAVIIILRFRYFWQSRSFMPNWTNLSTNCSGADSIFILVILLFDGFKNAYRVVRFVRVTYVTIRF